MATKPNLDSFSVNYIKDIEGESKDTFNYFPSINPARIITMKKSNISSKYDDWRYNIYSILQANVGKYKDLYTIFKKGDDSLWKVSDDVDLLLVENKGLNSVSSPDKPLKGLANVGANKGILGKVASFAVTGMSAVDAFKNVNSDATTGSFYPWMANISAWSGGNHINMHQKFDFAMGQYGLWNALEEVVKPILNLFVTTLPQHMNTAMIYGSYPNAWDLLAHFVSDVFVHIQNSNSYIDETGTRQWAGSTTAKAEELNKEGLLASQFYRDAAEGETTKKKFPLRNLGYLIEKMVLDRYKQFTYDITYGNMFTFYKMLPISSKITWSNEVDQYGWPISGSVEMDFEGLMPISLTSYSKEERAVKLNVEGYAGTYENGIDYGYSLDEEEEDFDVFVNNVETSTSTLNTRIANYENSNGSQIPGNPPTNVYARIARYTTIYDDKPQPDLSFEDLSPDIQDRLVENGFNPEEDELPAEVYDSVIINNGESWESVLADVDNTMIGAAYDALQVGDPALNSEFTDETWMYKFWEDMTSDEVRHLSDIGLVITQIPSRSEWERNLSQAGGDIDKALSYCDNRFLVYSYDQVVQRLEYQGKL